MKPLVISRLIEASETPVLCAEAAAEDEVADEVEAVVDPVIVDCVSSSWREITVPAAVKASPTLSGSAHGLSEVMVLFHLTERSVEFGILGQL